MSRLDDLAAHHGLSLSYDGVDGGRRPVPDTTKTLILRGLGVDPKGAPRGRPAPRRMVVPAQGRCWMPPSLSDAPGWGLFCQLYELRSDRNWGIGDFADLADLARIAGRAGADFLGVNPLHALFLSAPNRRSPFFPSNRRFLNPLYIAPDLVGGIEEPPELGALRKAELLDYGRIAALKLGALRKGFAAHAQGAEIDTFAETGGPALRRHAEFEAISAHMVDQGRGAGWHDWPEALRDPAGSEVRRLAEELAEDVRFQIWLQMIARRQLARASRAAAEAGMRIGLYLDLAVGEAPDGSATWSGTAMALPGLSIGAPPDVFATEGQNWGLAAPSPTALRRSDFAPFREMIESQLSDAGALRIDHAMAIWQLFLIPDDAGPAAGTHLRYPFGQMLKALASLSHEHEALIIGEDLGFVPPGFRDAMEKANIFSYRILYFEQDAHGFKAPEAYPEKALACLSTHDLPVLALWWRGEDIELRARHGLVEAARTAGDRAARAAEREKLVAAMRAAGALSEDVDTGAARLPDPVLEAAHRFLARTSSRLVGVRLADLVGPEDPTNLPGTTDEYPNWQPRSPVAVPDLAKNARFRRVTEVMRRMRPRNQRADT